MLSVTLCWASGTAAEPVEPVAVESTTPAVEPRDPVREIGDEVERCLVQNAPSPAALVAPPDCGPGGWIPKPLLIELLAFARRGEDCDADIKSAVKAERARCTRDKLLLSVVADAHAEEAARLRLALRPRWITLVWKGALAAGAGAAVGAAAGAGGRAITGNEGMTYGQSAGAGAAAGAVTGALVVTVYELLR